MPALLAAAFAAGVLTILAPCSVPILPLAAGAGAERRGLRLAAVLVGFAVTFLLTTVLLAGVLAAAGVTSQPLRVLVALVLAGAGIALALPRAWSIVEARARRAIGPGAVPLGQRPGPGVVGDADPGTRHEAARGLALGAGIGLLWAPCTGPLMAPVIAGAIVAGPSADGLAIAAAYVAGAAVPLAAIAIGGRALGRRLGAAVGALRLRRAYGVVVLVAALAIATGSDVRLQAALAGVGADASGGDAAAAVQAPDDVRPDVPLEDLGPAPELAGITAWINTPPLTMASLRGKVVLVHFWTFACRNCLNVQPYVKAWADRYAADGLVVVGVHTPELSFERDLGNVRQAVADQGVRFPVAFDPDFATWRAYGNGAWPAFWFVDRRGEIRYAKGGEGGYAESEAVIRELLAQP
jgi:cytochrome c biogenesis protein CcdA/thiol-disulfide isomerase/thioredoxin